MKGTICSATLAALVVAFLCAATFAARLDEGSQPASDSALRWERDGDLPPPPVELGTAGQPQVPPPHVPEERPPVGASENEGSDLVGATLGSPDEKSPVSWLDPPDTDVELTTWGLVKDLFIE